MLSVILTNQRVHQLGFKLLCLRCTEKYAQTSLIRICWGFIANIQCHKSAATGMFTANPQQINTSPQKLNAHITTLWDDFCCTVVWLTCCRTCYPTSLQQIEVVDVGLSTQKISKLLQVRANLDTRDILSFLLHSASAAYSQILLTVRKLFCQN